MAGDEKAGRLPAAELEAAKRYMRPDADDDDETVIDCVLAARDYMTDAGVKLPEAGTPRRAKYDLVCHAMALSSYDQRDPVITGAIVAENIQLRRMLIQLRMTEPRE